LEKLSIFDLTDPFSNIMIKYLENEVGGIMVQLGLWWFHHLE
jgi:hypothetical protein